MIAFPQTLAQLRERIDSLIARIGADAPVGCAYPDGDGVFLNEFVQVEWVCVNAATGRIVGDEAEDYRPKEGERNAAKLS